MFIFFGCSVISYADEGDTPYDEVDTYEEFIESYEKVPIEIQSFDKDTRILTGHSISGAMVTIDTGESVTVGNDGKFQFKIPKEIRMVIINAVDEEGMGPNSVSYNIEENKIINEEDETPVPDIEETKRNDETKQNKNPNENQNNKEQSKKVVANTSENNKKKVDTFTSESKQKNTKSSQTTESTKKLKATNEKVKENEDKKNK
jgi:hypothetical protein